ncbi:MAG TPA: hypothetical protein PK610_10045, partial [Flavobacteriales bacterium]|nr:hypothetical protein [Flavobacteriales bacterium]
MKNIIIGNGVIIQFGGKEYTNESIIKRATKTVKLSKHPSKIYPEEIQPWLEQLFGAIPDILNGRYDRLAVLKGEKEGLDDFKRRYAWVGTKTNNHEIGFEDYFLIHELFCRNLKISNPNKSDFRECLRMFFLDAIFNEGKINQVYHTFPDKFKKDLSSYE